LIGINAAEIIKMRIGNAHPVEKVESIEVKGRDLVTGVPKALMIDSNEIRQAISDQVETIVETVRIALEQTPPELAADIAEKGIVMTGGGSLLTNLDVRLGEETKVPINITEDPLCDVVFGSGKALDNLSVLKEIKADQYYSRKLQSLSQQIK
jgi:rod shape-determining protein MreB